MFVDTDDGYTYVLSLATVKDLQFLIEKDKPSYLSPGYPFVVVNKLILENIEQTVKVFTEEDNVYWLKIYHFRGCLGVIDENIFDPLKAKHIKRRQELDKDEFDE